MQWRREQDFESSEEEEKNRVSRARAYYLLHEGIVRKASRHSWPRRKTSGGSLTSSTTKGNREINKSIICHWLVYLPLAPNQDKTRYGISYADYASYSGCLKICHTYVRCEGSDLQAACPSQLKTESCSAPATDDGSL